MHNLFNDVIMLQFFHPAMIQLIIIVKTYIFIIRPIETNKQTSVCVRFVLFFNTFIL